MRDIQSYSNLVVIGDRFETSGQVADDLNASFADQVRQTLDNISGLLTSINARIADIVRVQVWLAEMDRFEEYDSLYRDWLNGVHPKPVRATVQAGLADPRYLIEIQVFGILGHSRDKVQFF